MNDVPFRDMVGGLGEIHGEPLGLAPRLSRTGEGRVATQNGIGEPWLEF